MQGNVIIILSTYNYQILIESKPISMYIKDVMKNYNLLGREKM